MIGLSLPLPGDHRLWFGGIAAILVIAAMSCGGESGREHGFEIDRPGLVSIDCPNLASLEDDDRVRVHRRELMLEEALADADRKDADLGAVFGELGKTYLAFGFQESAVGCFANAHSLVPSEYRWLHYLTVANSDLGQAHEAIRAARSAIAIRPDAVQTLVLLGDALLGSNQTNQAREAYSQAVRFKPDCAAAWYGLGQTAMSADDFEAAIDFFENALRHQPDASIVQYPLAMAYRGIGDVDKAQEHIRQQGLLRPVVNDLLMTDVDNRNAQTWIRRGRESLQAGRPEEAVRLLSMAVEVKPGAFVAWANLGLAHFRLGDIDRALEVYAKAERLEPDNYVVHTHIGTVLAAVGRRDEAIVRFRRAIELNPNDVRARFNLGQSLRILGLESEALDQMDEVLRLDPSHEAARGAQARLFAAMGDWRAAVETVESGLNLQPESVVLTGVLARLLAACQEPAIRNPERALDLARRAFEKEKGLKNAVAVALAHAAAGDFVQASAWQEQAMGFVEDRPGNAAVMEKLRRDFDLYQRNEAPTVEW